MFICKIQLISIGTLLSLSKPYILQHRTDLLGAFFLLWFCLFCLFVFVFFSLDKSWFLSQSCFVSSKLFGFWVCFVSFFSSLQGKLKSAQLSSFLKQNYVLHFVGYSLVPDQLMFTVLRLHIKQHKYLKFIVLEAKVNSLNLHLIFAVLPAFNFSI